MPKDKKPALRYQRINDIFNRRRGKNTVVRLQDLADELGVSLRQINEDIRVMREEMGAPMEYVAAQRGWRYSDEFNIVEGIALSREDVLLLRIFMETLNQSGYLKDFSHLPQVLNKIYKASRGWVDMKAPEKAIYFDPLPHYEGARYLGFMLDAIETARRIRFQYQGFHAVSPKTVEFDPWFLRHYDRRWYVGGFSHDPTERFVRVFPLERILGTPERIGYCHDKPRDFSADSYWKNIYGITVPPGGVVEEVLLEFIPLQGKFFLQTPFYEPFEILENTEARLVVRLHLIPNIDLERKLASYGADVKVLAPVGLAEKMRTFLEAGARRYNSGESG
ncbi:MAG: WYL domain-containing protein [Bacteroidota bacterium]